MIRNQTLLFLIVTIIISFVAISPLFSNGFFPMHDDTQVQRVYEMGKALSDGMFPVRWSPDLGYGYGYPLFNFYAPLSYYFGGFLNVLGLDALLATKGMIIFGMVLAGINMYFLARVFWGNLGGMISALFYMFAPYHALQVFVRGDVSEMWAYGFIPLMFLGFYKIFTGSQNSNNSKLKSQNSNLHFKSQNYVWRWIIVGALGFAGVILSHNLTAMMVTPPLILLMSICLYFFYKNKNPYAMRYMLYAFFLGLILSAFYWLPVFMEMKYTNVLSQIGGGANFRDHFVCLPQLWESMWGFGGSTIGCIDGMSFRLGKIHIATLITSIVLFTFLWNIKKVQSKVLPISFLGFFISVMLMLDISKQFWEMIPLMDFFQYPWRFLIMASFFGSFIAGSVIYLLPFVLKQNKQKTVYHVALVLLLVLLYSNTKLFKPQTHISKTSTDYTNEKYLRWTTSKISDEYMPKNFLKPNTDAEIVREKASILQGNGRVSALKVKTQEIEAQVFTLSPSTIYFAIAPFPTWRFFINDSSVVSQKTKSGYIVNLPTGRSNVRAVFNQTLPQNVGNIISLVGIAALFGIIVFTKKTNG